MMCMNLLREKNINKFSIIGHSMGGKLGMLFTLLYPTICKTIICCRYCSS